MKKRYSAWGIDGWLTKKEFSAIISNKVFEE